MKMRAFASRNFKEMLRDPLSMVFGIGLPAFLMVLLSLVVGGATENMPRMFIIENFVPAITMFSFSFISLFSGMLVARDRDNSFLPRLFASPLSAGDFIVGYALPMLPIALLQAAACFAVALLLGLEISWTVLLSILVLIPVALLFIGLGLLFGSAFTAAQCGGIFAILVQVASLSSGTWFDLQMVGETFRKICYLLPFAHAVSAAQNALTGNFAEIMQHLLWVIAYALVICVLAVVIFKRRMKGK